MKDSERKEVQPILEAVGGKENVQELLHCATRLRFRVKDRSLVQEEALKELKSVKGFVESGGQVQIIIGSQVNEFYSELESLLGDKQNKSDDDNEVKLSLTNKIFDVISGSFLPLLGILSGSGMLKALLSLALQFGWLTEKSETYVLLGAIANAAFYYLPVLLGYTIAKKLGANEFVGAIIGAALIEPTIIELAGKTVHFLHLPVLLTDYSGTVFPIFIAILFYWLVEKGLKKVVPQSLQLFMNPLLSLITVVPLTLLIFGPFGKYIGDGIANILISLTGMNGWLSGMVIGGCYTFIVVFGLHWGLVPIVLSNLALGGDPIYAMGGMSGFAQMGVALGVFLVAKEPQLKEISGSALLPALISGVTEPIIYGILVPYRKTFIYILIAGAVGGGINGFFHVKMVSYAFASLLAIPAYSPMLIYGISALLTILVGAMLVICFGYQAKSKNGGKNL